MRKPKVEVWIDSDGTVRVRQEYEKGHWKVARLLPYEVRETVEFEPKKEG